MTLSLGPLTPAHWPALEELFGRSGASNGCWCMYWRIGPAYRQRPRERNRGALRRLTRDERPQGLLAFDGDLPVGWCRLGPRSDLPWLESGRIVPRVDALPVWSLPCFYVRPSHRRRGVMAALIAEAVETARRAGAPALESYPVDTSAPLGTTNVFTGTAGTFERAGFRTVGRGRYGRLVMRRGLASSLHAEAKG